MGARDKTESIDSARLFFAAVIIGALAIYAFLGRHPTHNAAAPAGAPLNEQVIPSQGAVLPIVWGDLGAEMVKNGVIDKQKFEALLIERGGLTAEEKNLLSGSKNGTITITPENAGAVLDLSSGFRRILAEITQKNRVNGGSCGV